MKRYKIPPYVKYNTCFQTKGEIVKATQCSKSRAFTKFIGSIIYTEKCEHQCIIFKGILQSEQLK